MKNIQSIILIINDENVESDCVLGLEVGANDYLVKPFGNREFVARCRAMLRRHPLSRSLLDKFECCDLARSGCIDCDYRWFNSVWSGLCHELFDSFLYGSCLHRFRKRKPERRFLLHGQRSWTINRNVTIGSYFSSWRNASLLVDVLFAGGLSLAHQPSLTTNVEIVVFTAN